MQPTNRDARLAGLLYLTIGILGPFSLKYVPSTLIVRGDAVATAARIRASEMLFRAGIAAELAGTVAFLFVVLALYRLLSGVNKSHAAVMVILAFVSIPVSVLNQVNELTALTLLRGGDYLSVVDKGQLDVWAMVFLRRSSQGLVINEMFWGLWLFPFGMLVWRSGFLPKILGAFLIVNSFAYPAITFTALLAPDYSSVVSRIVFPALFGEMAIMLWLLILGIKTPSAPAPAVAST
jgi:hypothetical protein